MFCERVRPQPFPMANLIRRKGLLEVVKEEEKIKGNNNVSKRSASDQCQEGCDTWNTTSNKTYENVNLHLQTFNPQ